MTDLHLLDVPATYAELDPSGMGGRLLSLPGQAEVGWGLGGEIAGEGGAGDVSRVLVVGMGGSGIGGEMIKGLADAAAAGGHVSTWRDYGVPGWVDGSTLVAAVSVSGSTAETRSAFAAAGEAGAKRMAVTGPGPLREEASAAGVGTVPIEWEGEPRAALGFTFVAPLRALGTSGAVGAVSGEEFREAVGVLRDVASELDIEKPVAENPAKQIAIELGNRVPIVYGPGHLVGVAMRWKTQFNENANSWASWEALPEVSHNAVQGYAGSRDLDIEPYVLVLRPESCGRDLADVIDAHLEALSVNHIPNLQLEVSAPNMLGEVLVGALMGDMVSYYVAMLRGVDPSSTENIDALKGG